MRTVNTILTPDTCILSPPEVSPDPMVLLPGSGAGVAVGAGDGVGGGLGVVPVTTTDAGAGVGDPGVGAWVTVVTVLDPPDT